MENDFKVNGGEHKTGGADPGAAVRRAGALAPLFCVRSERSRGIGDAEDAKLLVDWCRAAGLSILQFLPLNALSAPFFSPYQAISSFALEPALIRLERVPGFRSRPAADPGFAAPAGPGPGRVDYRRARAVKLAALRALFPGSSGAGTELEAFRAEQAYWLEDFALFQALREHHGRRPWHRWPPPYRDRDENALAQFRREAGREIDFQAWLQWLAWRQFRDLKAHAAARGVLLMGDLPALAAGDSADVWAHRELFKLDYEAGAPPDMFSPLGQRWGMPPCDWEAIAAEGFRYPAEKLRYASSFYDLARIDHVVGLFRIWTVPSRAPASSGARDGFFDPPDEKKWEKRGREILRAMKDASPLGLCAEDLGVVPDACPRVLEELGIPGLEILRWAKDWHGAGRFRDPAGYRAASVAALSTHDTSNFADWWENEAGEAERNELGEKFGLSGPVPRRADPELAAAALSHCLGARSVYSIQLIFDWLAAGAGELPGPASGWRINTPGTTGGRNWTIRLERPLEQWPARPVTGIAGKLAAAAGRA